MKFLLDAQLPKKLSLFLIYKGHDYLHTLDLPHKNKSKDSEENTLKILSAFNQNLADIK